MDVAAAGNIIETVLTTVMVVESGEVYSHARIIKGPYQVGIVSVRKSWSPCYLCDIMA